jgi:hypothetical protein
MTKFIDSNGLETEDENKAYAKKEGHSFFVKKDSGGFLYNPNGVFSEDNFNRRTGKNKFTFQRTTEECYALYVKFLKTKNTLLLTQAQREIQ